MDQTAEIADLKRRLIESETRHRLLIGEWAQAEWETDADGVVVADSPSWRAYTGQTVDAWLGKGWLDAIHPDDRAFAERQWWEAIAARRIVDAEFRLRAPDGGWRWTNVRAVPLRDAQGNIEKWAGLNIDIDARKRAELALRRSEGRLRALFESIDEGYSEMQVILDGEGRVVDWLHLALNGNFSRVTGIPDITGRHASEVFPNLEGEWFRRMDLAYRTGEPQRFETELAELGRWFDNYITRLGGEDDDRVLGVFGDITERKLAERTLRESEERQAFLLALSDAMRPIRNPVAIQHTATRMLGEHLGASRVFYVTVEDDGDTADILADYTNGVPSRVGRYSLATFSLHGLGEWRAGRTASTSDVDTDPRYSEAARKSYASVSTRAGFGVPLIKDGRLVAILGVNQSTPRHWSEQDLTLTAEVAERTWAAVERARAEAALQESEERFAQFAASSADALWIRDAATLAMEYASPAIETIYGVPPKTILGDVRQWAALIVPDDRDSAFRQLERAQRGETVVHEFRIQRPSDGRFRWISNTDFPLHDAEGRIQRIGGIAHDVTEAKLAIGHSAVLLAELQHRVRNIMGMIRSMANRTAPGASDVADYRALLEGRLLALARVQALLTREANAGGSLKDIIESEVAAQAHQGGQYALIGPDVTLAPKAVEVLTLAFHELSTNALKYGALSVPEGRLTVSWTSSEKRGKPWLALDWIEEGAPLREPSTRRGFGSELIEGRIPYELGGQGKITICAEGARCHLEFPSQGGESILETDAPQPTAVFGGTLDMAGAPDLTGRRVLVVEDDYYMASDTAAALRGAGAAVLGPCPNEKATRELLEDEAPTHAVLDLNLGGEGPRFEIANLLKARGVPFVFLTGYDPDVIPPNLADVVRLQKPLPFRDVIEAVGQL